MSERLRSPIAVTCDIDGVLKYGPAPHSTKKSLAARTFTIPEEVTTFETDPLEKISVMAILRWLAHAPRPFKGDAVAGIQDILTELNARGADNTFSLLSGREPILHGVTRRQFNAKFPNIFTKDQFLLNPGKKSANWKEFQVRRLLSQGKFVIHIEDDLQAAWQVARTDTQNVLVFMIKNASNTPQLTEYLQPVKKPAEKPEALQPSEEPEDLKSAEKTKDSASQTIPQNIIFVDSFAEAAQKVTQVLEAAA